ncbi:hypothetical protein Cantr_07325 [Candida viswanathii]|uniref:Transcription activator GCR1-like domain-containing protein n=1 Tax=Candida viswanathii TaxID=5486 RepID=A0A367Y212_9ASCO|nr:hypothetical protein Cantr_07325 [Candida viswanathii]
MSQDTEDVIRMFKKFDDEVLTNAEARSRLLNLGVGTPTRPLSSQVPQTAPPRLTVLQQQPHQGRDGLLMEVQMCKPENNLPPKLIQEAQRQYPRNITQKRIRGSRVCIQFGNLHQPSIREFEHSNNLQPVLELNNNGVPIIDLNNKIYTVYEIIEEWYQNEPSIAERLKNWGEAWIRDTIDHNTFLERKSVVEFVEKMSEELNADIFTIANDCDRYIRDKSILQEFIAEIDLDVDDLLKKVLRYRQRRN